ncbi:TetR/AcrR family transcriptional regulator [Monashia sp. NPDC004114]
MTPPRDRVKTPRTYDSSRRREQARQSRARVVQAAERLFLANGYAATSISAVAEAADVSVDTIYKSFGGKPGLVRAIVGRAIEGEGPVPAEHRSDALQAQETDPRRIIAGWGRFVTELAPRASPLLLLVRAAAGSDPELQSLLDDIDAERLRRMTANARRLQRAGHLRSDVSVAAAADIMWTYSSAELYELLVMRRGMPLDRYGRFVADAMTAALL